MSNFRSEPCRSEQDFWAELDAEDARLDQALYNFRKREREQRPGWFRSYWQVMKWVCAWLFAAAVLYALIVGVLTL